MSAVEADATALHVLDRIVRDIHTMNGLIAHDAQGADRPVYPERDKRKRPQIWVRHRDFIWMQGREMIEAEGQRGFVLARAVVKRLKSGGQASEGPVSTRQIFTPDGRLHSANTNTRSTPLDRLARRRGPERGRWLSSAEVEAAKALARDYDRAGEGQIGTQDFTSPGVQGGDRAGAAERAMLSRLTSSTRLRAAREILGEDFAPGVIALCCRDESLDAVERAQRWATGSGKQLIKMGLARLVKLYGTETGERPR